MEGIVWSYLHFLGFSHRDLFLMAEESFDPQFHLELLENGKFPSWFSDAKKSAIRTVLAKTSFDAYRIKFAKTGARIVLHADAEFPEAFRHIPNAPFYLSVLGKLRDMPFLAVVGSRSCTAYGRELVKRFVPSLVSAGYGIVSGWALGIDMYAHEEAVAAGGYTVAIMGTGIDILYPVSHRNMYAKILDSGGAVISQFPLGTQGFPYNFPIRNELIAGLAKGTLVIEAKEKSGTLITAQMAVEMGKDVFVPPADYTRESSIGSNRLIQKGCAKLVLAPEDILIEYDHAARPVQTAMILPQFDDVASQKVYTVLQDGYAHPDQITERADLPVDQILVTLSMLELSGHVRMLSDGTYQTTLWRK